jgi:large subunit ribosomal protein L17
MRHREKKLVLGVPGNRKNLLIGNLATSLILHEKIRTTESKAKALQPVIDELINTAKNKNKNEAIRGIMGILHNDFSSKKTMEELVKRYREKKSGFTRITHIGFRSGDAAPVVQIELV